MNPAVSAAADPDPPPSVAIDGAVATIRLARPARRNALRPSDLQALRDVFAALDARSDVRVVLIEAAAAGDPERPVFCAGYDFSGFDDPDHDPRLFEQAIDALEALRPITVCALSGNAYGGATDLVLACDLRVARAGSTFLMPAAALGLHLYPGALRRYHAHLGPDLAKRAFLGAAPIAVEELQGRGLFDAIVPPERFAAAVAERVARAAALAPLAAAATKRSLNELAAGEYDAARLRAREAMTLASADFREGRAAQAQKRPPRFEGR